MAQVATRTVQARVDEDLAYLAAEWGSVPDVIAEWDEHERLEFVLEWPLREDRLRQLEASSGAGLLSQKQRQRYADLLTLVRHHRPSLDWLLAD